MIEKSATKEMFLVNILLKTEATDAFIVRLALAQLGRKPFRRNTQRNTFLLKPLCFVRYLVNHTSPENKNDPS